MVVNYKVNLMDLFLKKHYEAALEKLNKFDMSVEFIFDKYKTIFNNEEKKKYLQQIQKRKGILKQKVKNVI